MKKGQTVTFQTGASNAFGIFQRLGTNGWGGTHPRVISCVIVVRDPEPFPLGSDCLRRGDFDSNCYF